MQDKNLNSLHRRLRLAFEHCHERFRAYDAERQISVGYETRYGKDHYYWDGARHAASSTPPQVLFQYTFEGRGEYAEKEKLWSVGPGQGFLATLPGAYQYYLPEGSEKWTFFWLIVKHPFVSERISELRRQEAGVQTWEPGSPVLESVALLFEGFCKGKLGEIWNFEERLFSWLLETERDLYHRRYPQDKRQRLLDEMRQLLRTRVQNPPNAAELADIYHLERTTFSRHFKATTGISPAAFITEVRLEEALRLLRTKAKLDEVASSTGFADANHFCKVFRRHFGTSPGAYRRQMHHYKLSRIGYGGFSGRTL